MAEKREVVQRGRLMSRNHKAKSVVHDENRGVNGVSIFVYYNYNNLTTMWH